jgi:hypothetical protein
LRALSKSDEVFIISFRDGFASMVETAKTKRAWQFETFRACEASLFV